MASRKSGWAWEIGSLAGVRIRIHASFLLLVAWVALVHWRAEPSWGSVAGGTAFLFAVFALVIGHELCHALAARLFGIGTTDITLWPIGGVSRLERSPEEPHQELVVALAGPAFNIALALVIGAWVVGSDGWGALTSVAAASTLDAFAVDMVWANVVLGLFNLLPAFPMDGGRVLRASLAAFTGRARATRLAAGIAKAFAVLFGLIGLWLNPILLLIAVLVWLGAEAEASDVGVREAARHRRVLQATIVPERVLHEDEPLATAAALLLRSDQRVFPVRDAAGDVERVLLEADLVEALDRWGPRAPARAAARPLGPPLAPGDELEEALERLRAGPTPAVPVVDHGVFVGLVTPASVAALLRVAEVLDGELAAVADRERDALVGGPRR